GEISSPHSKPGDLLIICSGSGETGSLKSLAEKAKQSGIDLALVTMKKESTIGQLADVVLVLPGTTKEENDRETASFAQPMGSAFEQLAFLTFDGMVLNLMDELGETSETMFKRHADFE
ncbi:MAG: SIS domain-containing protein, partial [Enterococcus faecalis]|nr:SIS domain-containing protein [Enterococcus faecalis]